MQVPCTAVPLCAALEVHNREALCLLGLDLWTAAEQVWQFERQEALHYATKRVQHQNHMPAQRISARPPSTQLQNAPPPPPPCSPQNSAAAAALSAPRQEPREAGSQSQGTLHPRLLPPGCRCRSGAPAGAPAADHSARCPPAQRWRAHQRGSPPPRPQAAAAGPGLCGRGWPARAARRSQPPCNWVGRPGTSLIRPWEADRLRQQQQLQLPLLPFMRTASSIHQPWQYPSLPHRASSSRARSSRGSAEGAGSAKRRARR